MDRRTSRVPWTTSGSHRRLRIELACILPQGLHVVAITQVDEEQELKKERSLMRGADGFNLVALTFHAKGFRFRHFQWHRSRLFHPVRARRTMSMTELCW